MEDVGGKMLLFRLRLSLLSRMRSSSALDTNLMTSPLFVLQCPYRVLPAMQ
jgi:hypothetical protein